MTAEKSKISEAKSEAEIQRCYPVLRELRTSLSEVDFEEILSQAKKENGYRLVYIENSERQVLAVMGFRLIHDFVHGKHLYIDDLVTTKKLRSKGLGAELLQYAEQLAVEYGCRGLRLCTGIENNDGRRFYEKNGWTARALAYKKKLS